MTPATSCVHMTISCLDLLLLLFCNTAHCNTAPSKTARKNSTIKETKDFCLFVWNNDTFTTAKDKKITPSLLVNKQLERGRVSWSPSFDFVHQVAK